MTKLREKEMHTITKIVTSEDGKKTFSFSKTFDGVKGKHAIFILLYPTRTEENCHTEDSTNIHLLNHLPELGIISYTVVNLFSTVTQSRLSTRGLVPDKENFDFIRDNIFNKATAKNTITVVAWGNSHLTSHAVNEAKKNLLELWIETNSEIPLYQLTSNGLEKGTIGVHPLHLGIRHSNAVWKLTTFPHQKALKELAGRLEKNTAQPKKGKVSKEAEKNDKCMGVNDW